MLHSFNDVFKGELGTLHGEKVGIHIDPSVPPKFCKARSLPYAMKGKVEAGLQRLQDQGIISRVKYSKWAASVVPVLKQDKKTMRICSDYKLTATVTGLPARNTIRFLRLMTYLLHQLGVSCLQNWI